MPKEIIFFGGFATKAEALEFGSTLSEPWCILTVIKGFFPQEKPDNDATFDVMTFLVVNQNTVTTINEALVVE